MSNHQQKQSIHNLPRPPGIPDEQHVCATCALVLSPGISDGELVWYHAAGDVGSDHDPVPVRADAANAPEARTVCDFCSDPHPRWMFAVDTAAEIHIPEMDVIESFTSDWGACDVCAELIEAHDPAGLLVRSSEGMARAMFVRFGEVRKPEDLALSIVPVQAVFWSTWDGQPKREETGT